MSSIIFLRFLLMLFSLIFIKCSTDVGVIYVATGSHPYFFQQALTRAIEIAADGMAVTIFVSANYFGGPYIHGVNVVSIPEETLDFYDPSRLNNSLASFGIGRHGAKIHAILNSPYNFTIFLDTDTYPCMSMVNIATAAQSLMINHDIAAYRFPCDDPSKSCPIGINSGVIFLKRTTAVKTFLQEWGNMYRSGVLYAVDQYPCIDGVNRSDCPPPDTYIRDQPAWVKAETIHRVPVLGLGTAWNCKVLFDKIDSLRHEFHTCCTIDAELMFGLSCLIDHKCLPSPLYSTVEHDV